MDFRGLSCLVLRPAGQQDALAELLRERGARVTHCPTIAIEPLAVAPAELAALERADWLVFVSPNAVTCAVAALETAGRPLPSAATMVAVGSGTARTLEQAGIRVDVIPARGGGSDALLEHPRLQRLAGARIVIVRGEGGREHLAAMLRARGAAVEYLEVYRRGLPELPDVAQRLSGWRAGGSRVTIVTSVTGWQNLLRLADPASRQAIMGGALVAVSDRVRTAARADGHRGPVVVSERPGPESLAEATGEALRQITETDQ